MASRFIFRRLRWPSVGRWLTTEGPSIEASEVEKFSQVAWWNKRGELAILHRFNPSRTLFLRHTAASYFPHEDPRRPLQNKTVIDVGCGGGILSESLARLGGKVTGIDVIQANIDTAKLHAQHDPLIQNHTAYKFAWVNFELRLCSYQCIAAEDVVKNGEQFDLVVNSEVIEHVRNPLEFFITLSKLVKENGMLSVTTFNRTIPSFIFGIWFLESITGFLPKGTHDWTKFLTPEELTAIAHRCGLKLESVAGLRLEPLTEKWKTTDDISVNYCIAFSKPSTSESKSRLDINVSSTSL